MFRLPRKNVEKDFVLPGAKGMECGALRRFGPEPTAGAQGTGHGYVIRAAVDNQANRLSSATRVGYPCDLVLALPVLSASPKRRKAPHSKPCAPHPMRSINNNPSSIRGIRGSYSLLYVAATLLGLFCIHSPAAHVFESNDALEQLRELSEQAPARQLGQPGSEYIDRLIAARFAGSVQENNDPARQREAEAALEEVNQADEALAEAVQELEQNDGGGPDSEDLRRAVRTASSAAYEADLKAARALQGLWQHGQISFSAPVFVPGRHEMKIGDAKARLFQLWPCLGNPGNLPREGFDGRLVYAGHGTSEDFTGLDLIGAAAVLEFASGDRWLDAIRLGAELVIFLEPPEGKTATYHHAVKKLSQTPLSVPRFYMTRSVFAATFGSIWRSTLREHPRITIRGDPGRWEPREVTTDWLFIPGQAPPAADPVQDDVGRQIVHIQAFKDCLSLVPELSSGAESAANLVALLRLLDRFEQEPPRRPVLLSVVNDHVNTLNGELEFSFTAFCPTGAVFDELRDRERDLALQQFIHGTYRQEPDGSLLEELRDRVVTIAGRKFTLKEPAVDRLLAVKSRLRKEMALLDVELDLPTTSGGIDRQEMGERLERLRRQHENVIRLGQLFNRFGRKSYFDEEWAAAHGGKSYLDGDARRLLKEVFVDVEQQAKREADRLEHLRARLVKNLSLRRRLRWFAQSSPDTGHADYAALFAQRHPPVPCLAGITLDLTFSTDKVGFFYFDNLMRYTSGPNLEEYAKKRVAYLSRHTLEVARIYARHSGTPDLLEDTIRMAGGLRWEGHQSAKFVMGARAMQHYGQAALTLTGVRDRRPRVFTPHDTVDRIDPLRFASIMDYVDGYLPALVNADGLGMTRRPGISKGTAASLEISARIQDGFTAQLPKTKLPHAVVIGMSKRSRDYREFLPQLGQVRTWPMAVTDERGAAIFRSSMWENFSLLVFGYDPSFREINAALDFGEGMKRFLTTVDVGNRRTFVKRPMVAFRCRKTDLLGLTDALTLDPVDEVSVLDARQNTRARHFSLAGVFIGTTGSTVKHMPVSLDGSGSVFVEPHLPFKLRFGARGDIRTRLRGLAINTDAQSVEGRGFSPGLPLIRNLDLISARDMHRVTGDRLARLSARGVVTPEADRFHRAAGEKLEALDRPREPLTGPERLSAVEEAHGLALRAHSRTKGAVDDLIKAVVIFLALVLPFCFFVMKLLSPFTDVHRQLAVFVAIFVCMTILLFVVHPAFRVATAPYQVIVAFVILGMALFVTSVVCNRFHVSMRQMVEESMMAESADPPQGRLLGAAFMVGVNNMKRRRIRTTLTCTTIVLVTFTLLSVLGVRQSVEPLRVRAGNHTPYDGFVYSKPGMGPILPPTMRRLRAQLPDDAQCIVRAWVHRLDRTSSAYEYGTYLGYEVVPIRPVEGAPAKRLEAKALLGMQKEEDGFLGPMPLLEGGRWFSDDDAREIILSEDAAALLGITQENLPGTDLYLEGLRLKLVGLLKDEELERMRDLDDMSVLPVLVSASPEVRKKLEDLQTEKVPKSGSGGGIFGISGTHSASAREVAILPLELAMEMGPNVFTATYRTLSAKFDRKNEPDETAASMDAWQEANRLMGFQDMRLSVSLTHPVEPADGSRPIPAGQYVMISRDTPEITGVLKVAVPTILGAAIILNTMLGSVTERRREIGIYNAIGLNPTHVMVFFLAESLVFGVVGAVAGYLIGQILSVALVHFELWDLPLNYSSLSVVVVIFLSIATVVASTIFPAAMAARAAVPSGERKWSMPSPDGDEIQITFPFSYDHDHILGACAFLHDFMLQNSEASTGRFLAQFRKAGRLPVERPDDAEEEERQSEEARRGDGAAQVYALVYDVAPAPFDLGVNQVVECYAGYDPRVRAHMFSVHLTRISGQTANWLAVNQPFLEALRKRLLNWRSQRPATQQAYVEKGERLLVRGEMLPVRKSAS